MALDIMRMASHVRQGFEDGAERKRKETTRKLLGMSMQGDQDSLKQLYGVDPAAAQQVQTQQQAMHKEVADLMWRGATAIKQAPPEQKAQIYAAVRAEVAKHPESREWTAMLPPQYDPAQVDPAVDQLLAQTGLYQDQGANETWMNGGNGTMISNRGNSKPIEGYVQKPVGGKQPAQPDFPRKLADEEIVTMANKMREAGAPDEYIQNFMVAQQSMPDVSQFQPSPAVRNTAPRMSPIQEKITSRNAPPKPPTSTAAKASKQAAVMQAQLPALQRRIDRLQEASDAMKGAMFDGGPFDAYALSLTKENSELKSAAAQLKPLLMSFIRVPGIGAQSDLEAKLDSLQYPDASQPPDVRNKNIQELKLFIKDLTDAMNGGGVVQPVSPQAPANPSGKKDYSGLF